MSSVFSLQEFNANLFFPRPDESPAPQGSEDIFLEKEGIRIHTRFFHKKENRLCLIHFHGNGEIVSDYNDFARWLLDEGISSVYCDYRGYGKSSGQPTIASILKDSLDLFDLIRQKDLPTEIVLMGRSLGGLAALELALRRVDYIKALILESSYADPIRLVQRRGLFIQELNQKEKELYDNSWKIRSFKKDLLIIHGKEDRLILPEEAELNFQNAASQNKKLSFLDGVGHNDIFYAANGLYFSTLLSFLENYK